MAVERSTIVYDDFSASNARLRRRTNAHSRGQTNAQVRRGRMREL
jgi:hypothetical protein